MIRFSIIDYLNALPLNMAFKDGLFSDRCELIFDYPSQCADNLASRRADVGLISSIEYQRIPDLRVVPQICIASKEKVRSVVIVTRKPLKEVRSVALDRFSRTSVALLQVLFHQHYQRQPNFITMNPEPQTMLAEADAALVIGDAALRLPEERDFEVIDMAEAWFDLTGLPFVFAFWTVHKSVASASVAEMLLQAKRFGLREIEARIHAIQARWPLSAEELQIYFSSNIHYDLGEEELTGLARFYAYAHEAGIIPHVWPLQFVEV
jgi:chorismate dehydratase